jgi:hypothetical protein
MQANCNMLILMDILSSGLRLLWAWPPDFAPFRGILHHPCAIAPLFGNFFRAKKPFAALKAGPKKNCPPKKANFTSRVILPVTFILCKGPLGKAFTPNKQLRNILF